MELTQQQLNMIALANTKALVEAITGGGSGATAGLGMEPDGDESLPPSPPAMGDEGDDGLFEDDGFGIDDEPPGLDETMDDDLGGGEELPPPDGGDMLPPEEGEDDELQAKYGAGGSFPSGTNTSVPSTIDKGLVRMSRDTATDDKTIKNLYSVVSALQAEIKSLKDERDSERENVARYSRLNERRAYLEKMRDHDGIDLDVDHVLHVTGNFGDEDFQSHTGYLANYSRRDVRKVPVFATDAVNPADAKTSDEPGWYGTPQELVAAEEYCTSNHIYGEDFVSNYRRDVAGGKAREPKMPGYMRSWKEARGNRT